MTAWPNSIREINSLVEDEKHRLYKTLIPDWVFTDYGIDPEEYTFEGHRVVHFRCPKGSRAMELTVKRRASDIDPMLYLNMADTFNNQILVLLVVVNDPDAPRYNTDLDQHGNRTQFGTITRNIPAELEAMKAGLAPGQVRRGMRVFRRTVPIFEQFIQDMGHDFFFIEPLSYHNAIVFERYGFSYVRGYKDMTRIHEGFLPGGELHEKLTPNNPFRAPEHAATVRGRSWAIHDGILGHPFTGFQMMKRIGHEAGVNTFPDAAW